MKTLISVSVVFLLLSALTAPFRLSAQAPNPRYKGELLVNQWVNNMVTSADPRYFPHIRIKSNKIDNDSSIFWSNPVNTNIPKFKRGRLNKPVKLEE
ncbi:MAG: hypothetical protein NTU44_01225 [Bacteroidetes bacterium]|nr:hypothetical protein [Bacteroidota bacterium]